MSRKNAIGVHLLFWFGVAGILFGIVALFLPVSAADIYGQQTDCAQMGEIVAGWAHVSYIGDEADPAYAQNCLANAHALGWIALGSALLGAGLIAGATVWARRVFREDYQSLAIATSERQTV